ncbi:MAG: hypothetical protein JJU34_20680 [Lunatimonas sp.]|nr:hypothetical protein [Lunatimonas sp.]
MEITTNIKQRVKSLLTYNREELITLNLFWIGFLLYTLAWTITATRQINYIVFQSIQILGVLLMVPAAFRLIKFEFDNQYQKIVFFLIVFWAFFIFFRGFYFDKDALKQMILNPWFGAFLYFVPWVMLFPRKLIYYKKIFSVILISGLFFVLYSLKYRGFLLEPEKNVLSRDIVEYFSKTLAVTVSFILMTYVYHTKTKNLIALGILLLCIFFALVRARRGLLFMTVGSLFLVFVLFWINTKYKVVMFMVSGGFLFVLGSVAVYLLTSSDAEFVTFLQQRGTEDTRTGVEVYFYKDMEGLDWIVGRGMFGAYYSPTMSEGNYRGTIETDYLNMILKGGLIQLVLFLLIFLPAIYKGLFQSRNTLSKAAALWILFWLINTHPSTVQVFALNYLIVWFSVGICYSDTIRNLSEKGLRVYFRS